MSSTLFSSDPVPANWNNVRLRVRWMHSVPGGTGNVRWYFGVAPYVLGAAPTAGTQVETSQGVPASGVPHEAVSSGSTPVTSGGGLTVSVGRVGGSGADTFVGDIVVLDVWLERQG